MRPASTSHWPTANFASLFSNSVDGYDDRGVLSGTYSGSINTQSVNVTLNRAL